MNADDEVARERLRKFVMDVSGTSADRVHLVLGRREVPEPVRTDLLEDDVTPDELEKLSEPELGSQRVPDGAGLCLAFRRGQSGRH